MDDRVVVIHQPDFIPYLGFFHRLMQADIYIVLDNVQFVRGGSNCWTNRDKIKTSSGTKWITVPCKKAPLGININEIEINNDVDWKTRNLKEIENNYSKADGFEEVFEYIERLHRKEYINLSDFTFDSIKMLIELFDIKIDVLFSSELSPSGKSNERIVDLINKSGVHRYLSGIGAQDYYDPEPYKKAGIEIIWQSFEHPKYEQINGEFIPNLSSIDLLLNCGIAHSREILRSTI